MELKNLFAQSKTGPIIPTPTVYVYEPGTTTLVSGLQDKNDAPISNPFTGTADGFIQFAAPDGDYDVRVTGSGREFTLRMRFIDSVAGSAQAVRDQLLSGAAGDGAALVANEHGGTVQDHIDRAITGDIDYRTRMVHGVIRQATAGGGWSFLDDAGHKPNGLLSASVNGTGELVVDYGFTAQDVGSLVVCPDEVYANLGIWAGASVGDSSATIHLFQNLYGTVNLDTRSVAANTFFNGTLSAVLNSDGTVTVTHPSCGSASAGCYGGDTQGFDVRVQSYTATTVTFSSWVDFSGYIEWNGSAWTVSTQAFSKPTMVFNSGTLTVTHEPLATQDANVTVDGRDIAGGTNTVHIRPGQSTPTTFDVIFRDNAGAMLAAPSTSMRFYYSAVARVKRESPLGTINFWRPNCKLNANAVASGSGNFWIMGAMKVA